MDTLRHMPRPRNVVSVSIFFLSISEVIAILNLVTSVLYKFDNVKIN